MGWGRILLIRTTTTGPNLALYAAVARLGFRRQFAYLQAALWGMLTNLFFGGLKIAIMLALFGAKPQVAGYSTLDAVTYVALTQVFVASFSLFGWYDFMRTVHQGQVAGDLLRPFHLLGYWAAQDAGRALGQFVLRGAPMLLFFPLFWAIKAPTQPILTLVSVLLAWACGFAFRFLVNCAAFWSADAVGIGRFAWTLWGLGCGFLMPLAFFPDWLRATLEFTPFPGMLNTTVEVWVGVRTGGDAWQALGVQALWTLLLYALAGFALSRGLKRLEVAGG